MLPASPSILAPLRLDVSKRVQQDAAGANYESWLARQECNEALRELADFKSQVKALQSTMKTVENQRNELQSESEKAAKQHSRNIFDLRMRAEEAAAQAQRATEEKMAAVLSAQGEAERAEAGRAEAASTRDAALAREAEMVESIRDARERMDAAEERARWAASELAEAIQNADELRERVSSLEHTCVEEKMRADEQSGIASSIMEQLAVSNARHEIEGSVLGAELIEVEVRSVCSRLVRTSEHWRRLTLTIALQNWWTAAMAPCVGQDVDQRLLRVAEEMETLQRSTNASRELFEKEQATERSMREREKEKAEAAARRVDELTEVMGELQSDIISERKLRQRDAASVPVIAHTLALEIASLESAFVAEVASHRIIRIEAEALISSTAGAAERSRDSKRRVEIENDKVREQLENTRKLVIEAEQAKITAESTRDAALVRESELSSELIRAREELAAVKNALENAAVDAARALRREECLAEDIEKLKARLLKADNEVNSVREAMKRADEAAKVAKDSELHFTRMLNAKEDEILQGLESLESALKRTVELEESLANVQRKGDDAASSAESDSREFRETIDELRETVDRLQAALSACQSEVCAEKEKVAEMESNHAEQLKRLSDEAAFQAMEATRAKQKAVSASERANAAERALEEGRANAIRINDELNLARSEASALASSSARDAEERVRLSEQLSQAQQALMEERLHQGADWRAEKV